MRRLIHLNNTMKRIELNGSFRYNTGYEAFFIR